MDASMKRKIAAMVAATQGGIRLNDPNVVFLAQSTVWNDYAQLSVDRSARAVNLTNATTYAHNVAQGLVLTDNFAVELLVQMRTGIVDRYALINRVPPNNSNRFGLRSTSGNCYVNNGFSASIAPFAVPNLGASLRSYLWSCSVAPNPDTTGPSNAINMSHRIWDIDADEFVENALTGISMAAGAQMVLGALSTAGANLWSTDGHGRIAMCRISNRARSRAEIEATLPLILAGSPVAVVEGLATGKVFEPSMDTLLDPVSGITGVADGTTYLAGVRTFNGTTDRLDWASPIPLNPGEPFTFSVWVNADAITQVQRVLSSVTAGVTEGPLVLIDTTGNFRLFIANDIAPACERRSAGALITTGTWHHLAITYDGSNAGTGARLFHNGSETTYGTTTSGGGAPRTAAVSWSLGGRVSDDTVNLDGRIAQPQAWSRVLSPVEARNLYDASVAPA